MQISLLSQEERNNIKLTLEKYGFKVNDLHHKILFTKDFRNFYLNSLDRKDPYFLTTDINLEKFLKKNYFIKTKHTKSYQDKKFNEKMDLDEALEFLNWKFVDAYGIKEFDTNPTIEEPLADALFQIKIKDSPHIILDDSVYEGEATAIISLVKPLSTEALKSLSCDDILNELKIKDI
jgi:hypothetical protein